MDVELLNAVPSPLVRKVGILPRRAWGRAMPELSFAVDTETSGVIQHQGTQVHPFAGVGKLLFALTIAEICADHPDLPERSLPVLARHRESARTGTLRLLSGELSLSVDDAVNLVVTTGDGASTLALLEFFDRQEVNIAERAREVVTRVGLEATTVATTEHPANSMGEGLIGKTNVIDILALLQQLSAPMREDQDGGSGGSPKLRAEVSLRTLGWMHQVFEPAGLASALPGHGPHRVPYWTLSGWEATRAVLQLGSSSVLVTHSASGGWICAAAYHPERAGTSDDVSPRDVSAALGTLGLSAYLDKEA